MCCPKALEALGMGYFSDLNNRVQWLLHQWQLPYHYPSHNPPICADSIVAAAILGP